jgi:heat shock protein HslJ
VRGRSFLAALLLLTVPVSGHAQGLSPSPAVTGTGFSTLDGTDWMLLEMAGRDLPPDARITLSLRSERARGRDLCNAYVADFVTNGTALSFGRPTVTTSDCAQPDLGARYLDALSGTVTYLLDEAPGQPRLSLFQGAPVPGLVFRRSPPSIPLAGTTWRADDGSMLRFGDGVVGGTTSCGDWIGTFGTDGDWLRLEIRSAASFDCDRASDVFLGQLLRVESYLVDAGGLHLLGADGQVLLSFTSP